MVNDVVEDAWRALQQPAPVAHTADWCLAALQLSARPASGPIALRWLSESQCQQPGQPGTQPSSASASACENRAVRSVAQLLQDLSPHSKLTRQRALEHLQVCQMIGGCSKLPGGADQARHNLLQGLLHESTVGPLACDHIEMGKALVLRLDDASERCRELAVQCLLALAQVSQAALHSWCSPAYHTGK
jgi:hypothetical protein